MRSAALTSRSESLASRPKRSALEMDEEPCSKANRKNIRKKGKFLQNISKSILYNMYRMFRLRNMNTQRGEYIMILMYYSPRTFEEIVGPLSVLYRYYRKIAMMKLLLH
jgi:hypothetical protein